MTEKPVSARPARPGRDDRLKAALKANMARRKAQARARQAAKEATSEAAGGDGKKNKAGNEHG
ncbi:MAG: hypothetical protein CSA74_06135 [Rhodobacterales bacterium]|nr:MAG: hypothetical protein CSA74_06135 [Rhodobacterales bacterium]